MPSNNIFRGHTVKSWASSVYSSYAFSAVTPYIQPTKFIDNAPVSQTPYLLSFDLSALRRIRIKSLYWFTIIFHCINMLWCRLFSYTMCLPITIVAAPRLENQSTNRLKLFSFGRGDKWIILKSKLGEWMKRNQKKSESYKMSFQRDIQALHYKHHSKSNGNETGKSNYNWRTQTSSCMRVKSLEWNRKVF